MDLQELEQVISNVSGEKPAHVTECAVRQLAGMLREEKATRAFLGERFFRVPPETADALAGVAEQLIRQVGVDPEGYPKDETCRSVIQNVMEHPDLTTEGATRLVTTYMTLLAEELAEGKDGLTVESLDQRAIEDVVRLLGLRVFSVPLLGSAWRVMRALDGEELVDAWLVGNPVTPPAVAARLLQHPASRLRILRRFWAQQMADIHVARSDVDPNTLITELAHEPIPEDWFTDVLHTSALFEWAAPGVLTSSRRRQLPPLRMLPSVTVEE